MNSILLNRVHQSIVCVFCSRLEDIEHINCSLDYNQMSYDWSRTPASNPAQDALEERGLVDIITSYDDFLDEEYCRLELLICGK